MYRVFLSKTEYKFLDITNIKLLCKLYQIIICLYYGTGPVSFQFCISILVAILVITHKTDANYKGTCAINLPIMVVSIT
jgi:hypothetical protein